MVCSDGGKGSRDSAVKPHELAATGQAEQMAATSTLERKLAAIACHHQVETAPGDDVRRCHADLGQLSSYSYVEAFKLLHPFCNT